MDVVQAGHEAIDSGGETKMTENTPITEASDSEKIRSGKIFALNHNLSYALGYVVLVNYFL